MATRFPGMESCAPLEEGEARALIYRDNCGCLWLYVNGKHIACLNITVEGTCGGSDVLVRLPGELVKYRAWPELPPEQPEQQ